MSQHTPGPWTVGVYDATENFRSITHHACVCDPDTMALIAVTGPATDEQSQHDANLIAAAPDLLEALQGLVNIATHPQATKAEIRMIAIEARAAIAKATAA